MGLCASAWLQPDAWAYSAEVQRIAADALMTILPQLGGLCRWLVGHCLQSFRQYASAYGAPHLFAA